MKKILYLLALPFVLTACPGTDPMDRDFAGGGDAGLQEESLNNTVNNDYGESRISEGGPMAGAAPAGDEAKDLLFAGPKYYTGTPYKIEDIQYAPAEDYAYNQTGIAGIVPVDLNGVSTTNGEIFDTNAMVATSKVLPLPSIVRITNMDNGQSAVVRVNNRGPFVNSRLMDVSPVAAKKLGMTGQTKVQVQVMETESKKVKDLTLGTAGAATTETSAQPSAETAAPVAATGPYTVQVGAYYSEDSARSIANRISSIAPASVEEEAGMFKIRMKNMTADDARRAIQRLRDEENMAPGLLKDGRWVNADSI